jgi:tetratricopeptide (TPR) repeat protein
MSNDEADDPLDQWRSGVAVPDEEADLWRKVFDSVGEDFKGALERLQRLADEIDFEDEPYRARAFWSTIVRYSLQREDERSRSTLFAIGRLLEVWRFCGNFASMHRVAFYIRNIAKNLHPLDLELNCLLSLRLAEARIEVGDILGAIADARTALSLVAESLKPRNDLVLMSRVTLAQALRTFGRDSEARSEAMCALELHNSLTEKFERIQLRAQYQVFRAEIQLNFGDGGVSALGKIVETSRRVHGSQHPFTLTLLGSLGARLAELGRIDEGTSLCEDSARILSEKLGRENPRTLSAFGNLSACIARQGDYRRVIGMRLQNLELTRHVYGENHANTRNRMVALSSAYANLGNHPKALVLRQEVFLRRQAVLGERSRATLLARANVGITLMQLGKPLEALEHFKFVLRGRRENCEESFGRKTLAVNNLARCFAKLGKHRIAALFFRIVLGRRLMRMPNDYPPTLETYRRLAESLAEIGKTSEAHDFFKTALEGQTRALGPDHNETIRTNLRLSQSALATGEIDAVRNTIDPVLKKLLSTISTNTIWCQSTCEAAEILLQLMRAGSIFPWISVFRELGSRYVELIDLTDPEEVGYLRGHYARFHAAWLSLCLTAPDGAGEIPRVLSAISGRETAALVLAELEARGGAFAEGDPRRQYLEVLRELRRLRMMLRAQSEAGGDEAGGEGEGSGDGDGAGGSKRRARLDPEMAESIRQSRAAFRADLAARHDAAMARYKVLRAELTATDETFARAYAAPDTSTESLAQLLRPGEGLALLFSRRDADGQEHHHACCVTPDGAVTTLPLPELGTALSTVAALSRRIEVEQINRGGLRGGREIFAAPEPVEAAYADGLVQKAELPMQDPAVDGTNRAAMTDAPAGAVDLAALMRAGLWGPLTAHLPDVHAWHIATHQELHLLPVHLGLDGTRRCTAHPGLVFFWLNRRAAAEPVPVRPRLLIHVDPAEGSAYPIPFVEVEAELLRSIWGADAVEVVRSEETIARLQAAEPTVDTMVFVAHGNEIKGPPRTTVISASAIRGLQIDANTLLSAAQRPRSAVASACVVGRVSEDEGGEPLGLVSAFFVSGGRFVVAPLQPVSDLYMPIFMGLFHLAWRDGGDPAQAIVTARRQALSGDWPAGFADLVREAYRSRMTRQIENAFAQRDDREQFRKELEAIRKSWLPPREWSDWIERARDSAGGANLTGMDIRLYGPAARANLVTALIEAMLPGDGRKAPVPPALRAIVDWTVAFGD